MSGPYSVAPIRPAAAILLMAVILTSAPTPAQEPPTFPERTAAALSEYREALQLRPDLGRGAALFETCAACHGADGRGAADGSVPAIAGQHPTVVLKQLVDFRHDRRWNERMQNFAARHHLEDAQALIDVASFAASLPRSAPLAGGIGSGEGLQRGARVYFRDCESCHGPLGQGDRRRVRPRLAGQHYVYLLQQLEDIAANRRPGMDELHVNRIGALSDDERRGVADYLSRLSPELRGAPPAAAR